MNSIGCLFDLDGVLIDSESAYTRFWSSIDRIYPTGIDNYAIAIKGTTLPEIMKHYSDDAVKADILRRIDEFQATMTYDVFPGALRFLESLHEARIPAAIVTSSDDRKMARLWQQHPALRGYFRTVIDASMISRSKPDPEGYLKAAHAIGCRPENCFVFEDSIQGLKAGVASGATTVALATTYSREAIRRALGNDMPILDGFDGFTVERMLSLRQNR